MLVSSPPFSIHLIDADHYPHGLRQFAQIQSISSKWYVATLALVGVVVEAAQVDLEVEATAAEAAEVEVLSIAMVSRLSS